MVGYRNPAALLQCNTYLRRFGGSRQINVVIDPGSQVDGDVVERNLVRELGDLEAVHSFTVNHQDPDVVANAPRLTSGNPNISAVMTEEVWRLVQHLGMKPRRLHFLNAARSNWLTIADEYRWRVVPTPFCHFRGAAALYDAELRILFSGDLFGGFNRLGMMRLWAEEDDWAGIAQFHQIYMPSREALRYAVRQIRALQPAVEIIAPQHGFVIGGDCVPLFLERMHDLLVGMDLLATELDGTYLARYRDVLAQLLEAARVKMGDAEVARRMREAEEAGEFCGLVRSRGDAWELEQEGYAALSGVFRVLARAEPVEIVNSLRETVLKACIELEAPIPPVGAGLQEGVSRERIGGDGIQLF